MGRLWVNNSKGSILEALELVFVFLEEKGEQYIGIFHLGKDGSFVDK